MPRPRLSIPLPPAWLLSNLVVLALVAGFLWLDKEHLHWYAPEERSPYAALTPEPDHIVGIEPHCGVWRSSDHQTVAFPSFACGDSTFNNTFGDGGAVFSYLEMTVRTPEGRTYTVKVDAPTQLKLGDPWPP